MWRHRYSNQWIWHVQWTGTPERLNIRRGSALTKWSQKKKKKKPNPTTSPSLFIGTEALKGLTSGASAHSSEARKIRRAYPTFFSLFLFSSTLPFLPPSLFFSSSTSFVGAGEGARMGPSQGNFWRSGLSGRPGRANASWSCGERQWLSVLSGIQDAASASVYCEMCALPGDMDLGNYLLAWKRVCLFCAVISVQVLTVKEREKDWLWEKK